MTRKNDVERKLDDLEVTTGVKGLTDDELVDAWRADLDPNKSIEIDASDAYIEMLIRDEEGKA